MYVAIKGLESLLLLLLFTITGMVVEGQLLLYKLYCLHCCNWDFCIPVCRLLRC